MKKIISIFLSVAMIATLTACGETQAEIALSDYIISSGTYTNGDAPYNDIPFITYSISVPSDWTAEKNGYWENEIYYRFHRTARSIYMLAKAIKGIIWTKPLYHQIMK